MCPTKKPPTFTMLPGEAKGTPKTLADAIGRAVIIGPLDITLIENIHKAVRDYIAQSFGAAFLRADNPQELARLKELWTKITGEVAF